MAGPSGSSAGAVKGSGVCFLLLGPLRLRIEYGLHFCFACLSARVDDLVPTPMLLSRLPSRRVVR